MTVKTLTGSSIQDALAKARSQLGDDVVLMESTPATEDSPAQIAVMVDPSAAETTAQHTSNGHVPKPPSDGPLPTPKSKQQGNSGSAPSGFGYGGGSGANPSSADEPSDPSPEEGRNFGSMLARERGTGRGRLFPLSDADDEDDLTRTSETDRSSLSTRTGQRTGKASGAKRWGSHPLYDVLVDKGLRTDTVTQLFDELSDRGIDLANNPPDDLRWAFAQLLCRRIEVGASDRAQNGLALIGPGGAGKTSLLLKLATHDHLLQRGEPVVLHLQPEVDHGTAYQNPTDLYRQFGVPVQNVRTEDEMGQALARTENFGPVLIDTPPLPLPLDEGRPVLRRFEQLLRPLQPLNVHFVLSATHAFDSLDATTLQHLPVRPDAVSMTHLDEARTWGRVAEWLMTIDLPVRFISKGAKVPDGARAFSLEWFVDDVMDL